MLMASTCDEQNDNSRRPCVETTRRICIKRSFLQVASVMGAVTCTSPRNEDSEAQAATASEQQQQQEAVSKSWLCDPAVSSWKKHGRTVHIVGTAHISSVSADLAGKVVREVQVRVGDIAASMCIQASPPCCSKPDCLFLELDLKRIERAFRGGRPIPGLKLAFWDSQGKLRVGTTMSGPEPSPFVSWLEQGITQLLQREGFLAGEEMITSVQEAFNIGATVVLGDRDFDISMRRLAAASKNTDTRMIFEVNRVMTEMMKNEMPQVGQWSTSKKPSKDDVRGFIEALKTREMVDKLMATFKSFTPEIYTAMVKERDEYMTISLAGVLSLFPTVVAVVGLAHVDGMTRNLETLGWRRNRAASMLATAAACSFFSIS
jgi:pheromone shutdown protein TraB